MAMANMNLIGVFVTLFCEFHYQIMFSIDSLPLAYVPTQPLVPFRYIT